MAKPREGLAMNWVAEYFAIMGVGLVFYFSMRLVFVHYMTSLPPEPPPSRLLDFTGKGIEAEPIRDRVEHLKDDLRDAHKAADPQYKRETLVTNKREQMAKLSFFQPAPSPKPEPHEPGEGMHLLLV